MSSIVIDQPQSEKNLTEIAETPLPENLNFKFSNQLKSGSKEMAGNEIARQPYSDSIAKIEQSLTTILTSPTKTKLLLMLLENLQSSIETEECKTGIDSQSAKNQTTTNIPGIAESGRIYRSSLPQMACLTVKPRISTGIVEVEPQKKQSRKTKSSRIKPSNLKNQIVVLDDNDNLRPTLKKFDIDEIKPRRLRPWSLDVDIALREILGRKAGQRITNLDLSAKGWIQGYQAYCQRSHASEQYVYIWADVHTYRGKNNCFKKDILCLYGVDSKGYPTLLTIDEGDPSSAGLWRSMLERLEQNNLANPRLFIGSSNLSIWDVLPDIYPRAQWQFCWDAMKTEISNSVEKEHKDEIQYMVEMMRDSKSELEAVNWAEKLKNKFGSVYPHAVVEILKSQDKLFTYYRYPQAHWNILKSTREIASGYPPDDLLATIFKYEPFQKYSLYLVFNYLQKDHKNRTRINGKKYLKKVVRGKYPRSKTDHKPEIEFVQTEVAEIKKTSRNALAQKINNDESGALIQPAKKVRKASKSTKADQTSKPKMKFPKIVLKRKPESAPASVSRTEELQELLQERLPKETQSAKRQLLDNLTKLSEIDNSQTDKQPAAIAQGQKLSTMEMEILAGKR